MNRAELKAAAKSQIKGKIGILFVITLIIGLISGAASAVLSLIPGGSLYYTMNYALNEQWDLFVQKAFSTLELALALAVGIIAVTTLTRMYTAVLRRLRHPEVHSRFP